MDARQYRLHQNIGCAQIPTAAFEVVTASDSLAIGVLQRGAVQVPPDQVFSAGLLWHTSERCISVHIRMPYCVLVEDAAHLEAQREYGQPTV